MENRNAHQVSYQIQDEILTKVAGKMWEKELTDKFMHKYTTTWGSQFGNVLFPKTSDGRKDDGIVTPKRRKEMQDKKENILRKIHKLKNPYEPQTPSDEETLNAMKKQAQQKFMGQPVWDITSFPNESINPVTTFKQVNYEENEPVSDLQCCDLVL